MILLPIYQDPELNADFAANPNCVTTLEIFTEFYGRVGFNPPWICYFVSSNGELIGGGGFKGSPKNGRVEISYGVFDDFLRKGYGTQICYKLIVLALKTDPSLTVTARTLPDNAASIGVLRNNGFELIGNVWDDDDGDVLEWIYKK